MKKRTNKKQKPNLKTNDSNYISWRLTLLSPTLLRTVTCRLGPKARYRFGSEPVLFPSERLMLVYMKQREPQMFTRYREEHMRKIKRKNIKIR